MADGGRPAADWPDRKGIAIDGVEEHDLSEQTEGPKHEAAPMAIAPLAIKIELEYADRVNFAMQQNGVPLVGDVALTNTGDEPLVGLTITVALENNECESRPYRVDRIDPQNTYHLDPGELQLNGKELATRTEAERTSVRVTVTSESASASESFPIDLLAFDQWPGVGVYPELLAAFVTPNHPKIAELLADARTSLGALSGRDALDGYQSGSRERASHLAESCFNALLNRGIGYINPPASFDQDGQRVRLVDRICRENFGSCLDLSLLVAGMWEQAGLHPLILLPEGHAMPAVWTRETHLPEPAIDEPSRIRNLIELGEIVPVESTLLTHPGATFDAAVGAAREKMDSPGSGFCAIDIQSGRKRGVRPLPLRADTETSELDLQAVESVAAAETRLDRVALADRAELIAADDGEESDVASETPGNDRIERWKTRLLDLSLRNRLINFRETGRTIQLRVHDVARFEDLLAGDATISILPKTDGDDAFIEQELDAHHVHTTETAAETQKRLLQLYRTAISSIAETGANLLHIAVGMLKWHETESSEKARRAPLILLPVTLERRSTGSGYLYRVNLSNEPLRPNITLLEKLRTDFGIETAGLEDLPEDESGLDVPLILRNFRAAIRDTARWEVEETAFLGLFSFNKFLMWRDLQENLDRLRDNRLVRHLVGSGTEAFDPLPLPNPDTFDDEVEPGELYCTRDADSTQLAAIRAAADKRTFVLEGPPGTGKSQTIANMIADSLARGKRVLFVAEKMAALTVVRRRLEEDGLAPFCLELHSAKASKKEVLAQLEEALHADRTGAPAEWEDMCRELGSTRDQLNTYVRELHAERETGETLFEMFGRLSQLGDGPRVDIPSELPAGTTRERLTAWRECVAGLADKADAIDPPHEHPLRGIGRSEWSFRLPQEVQTVLMASISAARRLAERLRQFLDAIGVDGADEVNPGRTGVHALADLAQQLLQCPHPDGRLLVGAEAPAVLSDLRRLVEQGRDRDRRRDALLERYRPEFLAMDLLVHLDSVSRTIALAAPLRWLFGIFERRKMRAYCAGRVPDLATLHADLETARAIKQISGSFASAEEPSSIFGRAWKGGEADFSQLESILNFSAKFQQAATVLRQESDGAALVEVLAATATDADRSSRVAPAAGSLVDAWKDWDVAFNATRELLLTSGAEAFGDSLQSEWLPGVDDVLNRWSSATGELNDWCVWRQARSAAVEAGLLDLVEHYERGDLELSQLSDTFERSFGEKWLNAVADSVDAIREFNANAHGKVIDRFRAIDRAIIHHTRFAVAARLSGKMPAGAGQLAGQVSAQSEMGVLRRELEKKRRHMPTRRLIEAMPNLLPRLKPCFLMSPLSIAQYLDPNLPPFDLVVFDEASQIPVWDSIGAIARGAAVIVVGDSKQLPPTNFFNVIDGDSESEAEDFAVDDMESILKECNASGIPPMRLRWHYRSRHESLIAFSNHYYYQNKLHTFPSPEERSAHLGVTYRHVADGVYDRGGSRTNRIEAERVVDEVVTLLTASGDPDSIGIVTFNQAQQSLIEDLLDERRRETPSIEPFFTNESKEPVFVKNLENVQGDERDTILFSVGYGPDQTGRHSMNFGPLNQDGGERRLNVAITRARRRLIVFSSMRSDQIDLRRTRALGVKHFKTFLDYADRGPQAIAEAIDHSGGLAFESGFERAVWEALTAKGLDVDAQVGCAGYRIDLAVRDPERSGRYLIGIECDGAAYHSAKTARDRDRLRQSVLEGLGWRIERIWSTEWRINPARCVESIMRAVTETREGESRSLSKTDDDDLDDAPDSPSEVKSDSDDEKPTRYADVANAPPEPMTEPATEPAPKPVEPAAPTMPDGVKEYRRATPSNRRLRNRDVYEPSSTAPAIEALVEIVQAEGPIVEELALRRLAEWFGGNRVTDRYRERFAQIRRAALQTQPIKAAKDIFWPGGTDPREFALVRIPGPDEEDRRDLEHIPLIERVNAVAYVLGVQFGLPREDLERETAKLLGTRITPRLKEAIGEAIDAAIEQGRAVSRDSYVSLPPDGAGR